MQSLPAHSPTMLTQNADSCRPETEVADSEGANAEAKVMPGGRPGPKLPAHISTPQGQAAAAASAHRKSGQWLAHNALLWVAKVRPLPLGLASFSMAS